MDVEKSVVAKNAGAFRTISEVAADLDLPQHVLRFWETRFPQIRPLKRAGGRRFYRPVDVDLLRDIRDLLYGQGYTIKGVQRLLRERGARGLRDEPARRPPDPDVHDRDGLDVDEVGAIGTLAAARQAGEERAKEEPVEELGEELGDQGAGGAGAADGAHDLCPFVGAEDGERPSDPAPPLDPPEGTAASLHQALAIIEDCERRLRAALLPGD